MNDDELRAQARAEGDEAVATMKERDEAVFRAQAAVAETVRAEHEATAALCRAKATRVAAVTNLINAVAFTWVIATIVGVVWLVTHW